MKINIRNDFLYGIIGGLIMLFLFMDGVKDREGS